MINRIVLISGKQGSGKTTMGKLLVDRLSRRGIPAENIMLTKFAEPLYKLHDEVQGAAYRLGLIPEVKAKDGKLLQLLGTEWIRNTIDPDAWMKYIKRKSESFFCQGGDRIVIVDDCRFPNELESFPDAYAIRLECPEPIRKARTESWRDNTDHPSETALDSHGFDLFVDTSDSEDFALENTLTYLCDQILNQPKEG